MTTLTSTQAGRCDARIDQLRAEFGGVLADRIITSELPDFLWEARVCEHYLGQHVDLLAADEHGTDELSRILVLSWLDGMWHVAVCLVDGEGAVQDLAWDRPTGDRVGALAAFRRAR